MYLLLFFTVVVVFQKLWTRYVKPERGSWIPTFDYIIVPESHVIRFCIATLGAWAYVFGTYSTGDPAVAILMFIDAEPHAFFFAVIWVLLWTIKAHYRLKERRTWNPCIHLFFILYLLAFVLALHPRNVVADVYEVPFLSPKDCDWVVEEAHKVANVSGWTEKRHASYPTNDIPLERIPSVQAFINTKVDDLVFPFMLTKYGGFYNWIADAFVVRYKEAVQVSLDEHVDGEQLTFNIMLSSPDDYDEGGTYFRTLNKTVRIGKGRMLIHPARLYHSGIAITKGIRLVLVGFIKVEWQPWDLNQYFPMWGMWPFMVRYKNLTTLLVNDEPGIYLDNGVLS